MTSPSKSTRKQLEPNRDSRSREELRRNEAFLAEGHFLNLTGPLWWNVATNESCWFEQLYCIYEFEVGVPLSLDLIKMASLHRKRRTGVGRALRNRYLLQPYYVAVNVHRFNESAETLLEVAP